MNIFDLLNKIRKITADDKLRAGKLIAITCVALVVIILIVGTLMGTIIEYITEHKESRYTIEETPIDYAEQVESYIYTAKRGDETQPSKTQKDEFDEKNCLEFTDIVISNNKVSFEATNKSDKTIKNVSVDLYNRDKQLATTLTTANGESIKPQEKYIFQGIIYDDNLYIHSYLFSQDSKFIEIRLGDKIAITDENSENQEIN